MMPFMLSRRIAFLGGNGHCAARLAAARRHLPAEAELIDTPYPGFEGRPRAESFERLLDAVGAHLRDAAPARVYAWASAASWRSVSGRGETSGRLPCCFRRPSSGDWSGASCQR